MCIQIHVKYQADNDDIYIETVIVYDLKEMVCMYNIIFNTHTDENMFHIFSSEATGGIKRYKKDKPQYNEKKSKKDSDKEKKETLKEDDTSTIDIRC